MTNEERVLGMLNPPTKEELTIEPQSKIIDMTMDCPKCGEVMHKEGPKTYEDIEDDKSFSVCVFRHAECGEMYQVSEEIK